VFVPPNCTSHLQVADVVLQRPFKAGLRNRFNEWAAGIITEHESEAEEDEEKDELDVMKERQYGSRKSARKRSQPAVSGYMLNSSQIHLTEDSES
jgi:hypothetical protein